MGVSVQSGSTAVSGTVTAVGTFTATKNTVIGLSGTKTGAGTTTLGTVGAGKVWRVIALHITASYAAASAGVATLSLNGVECINAWTAGSYSSSACGNINLSYSDAYVLAAGQTVVLTGAASLNCSASISYIEESA